MKVLVLNVGSATLKFQLVQTDAKRMASDKDERLARGVIERIGGEAPLKLYAKEKDPSKKTIKLRDHRAAIESVLDWLTDPASGVGLKNVGDIDAVGHRVVHGGERFSESVLIDEDVLNGIEDTIDLAPLHNPHNLKGIQAAREVLGKDLPQVAVFDTAFHQSLPDQAFLYAIPYSFYRRYRIRRYGFHGTSHRYLAYRYGRLTGTSPEDTRLITLHLGNGCSACAIKAGKSVDTSMGFTPLEGLVMGTRSGDIDPALLEYISGRSGMSLSDVDKLLNRQSGLLGISGLTNDMRELLAEAREHGDRRAQLAVDIFSYRVRKYIGAYMTAVGGAPTIVFSGGIGENTPDVRAASLQGLEWLGLEIDAELNERTVNGNEGPITTPKSAIQAWVIPTDEELLIARDTVRIVSGEGAKS